MSTSGPSMSCAPSPGEPLRQRRAPRRTGSELSALDLTLRALRPLLDDPGGHRAVHQPAAGGCSSRRVRAGAARPLPFADFDWCRRFAKLVANVTRQRIDEIGAAAVGIAALGRARADRAAAGDHARLRRDHHPPAGGDGLVDRGAGAAAARSRTLPAGAARARMTRERELLRLHAARRLRGLHAPGGASRARTSWSPGRPARARPPGPRR